mgnify:CR=1 FL=1
MTETYLNQGNEKNMEKTIEIQKKEFDGLCYVNLVDGDMIYGHRRDIAGYAGALTRFDEQLGEFLDKYAGRRHADDYGRPWL